MSGDTNISCIDAIWADFPSFTQYEVRSALEEFQCRQNPEIEFFLKSNRIRECIAAMKKAAAIHREASLMDKKHPIRENSFISPAPRVPV